MVQFNRVKWDTLAMANERKAGALKSINVDAVARTVKEDIKRHLEAIVTFMNEADKHGLEPQFNIAKMFNSPDKAPEYGVQNLTIVRRY